MKRISLSILLVLGMAGVGMSQPNRIDAKDVVEEKEVHGGSLSGKITEALTGLPLEGANIYFPDLRIGTVSDADGHYAFSHLPTGQHVAEVSYAGHASVAITIVIDGDIKKDISLSTTVAEHNNVTVTGVSKATSIKRTPVPVSIVSKAQLDRSSGTNLMDGIRMQPGVSMITTGPAISKPVIRGLGYNRLITINDGVRQEGQQWGDEHGIEIDEYSAQKVEVLRGPASLMYGSDGLAGVINILTNVPVPQGTMKARLSGSLNDNNDQRGAFGSFAGNVDGFSWNLYGSYKKAGDYRNANDGKVLNSRFREGNFGGYVGVNRNWGYSHLLFSRFDQKLGMVEGERDANGKFLLYGGTPFETTADDAILNSTQLLIPYQHITHTRFALDNSINIGSGRLSALVAYQQNLRREYGDITAPQTPELWFDLRTINYNVAYHLKERAGWKTSIGINGMQQTNANKAEETLIPEYSLFDIGAFIYTQKQLNDRLTASGGVRFDNRQLNSKLGMEGNAVKFDAFKRSYSNLSASAGISYAMSDVVTLKANVARGFRAPSLAELASQGEHEGTNRYEIGNKDLKSETSLQADGGIDISTSHFTLGVSAFYNNVNNMIYYRNLLASDGSDSLINGSTVFEFSQQTGNLSGVEFTFDLHPHPFDWLHFENSLSIVRGRFSQAVDGSSNLPLITPARFNSELRAEFPKGLENLDNFYVKLEMVNVARQNDPFTGYGTETVTDGYTLFNFGLGTDLVFDGRKLCTISLAMNNLGDVAYQDHQSRLKYTAVNPLTNRQGVFNMGRNFTARLIIPMDWKVKR